MRDRIQRRDRRILMHSRHVLKADLFHFALQGCNLLIFGNNLTPQELRDFEVVSQAVVVLVLKLPVLLYQLLVLHLLVCQCNLLSLSTAYYSQEFVCSNSHIVADNETQLTPQASQTVWLTDQGRLQWGQPSLQLDSKRRVWLVLNITGLRRRHTLAVKCCLPVAVNVRPAGLGSLFLRFPGPGLTSPLTKVHSSSSSSNATAGESRVVRFQQ